MLYKRLKLYIIDNLLYSLREVIQFIVLCIQYNLCWLPLVKTIIIFFNRDLKHELYFTNLKLTYQIVVVSHVFENKFLVPLMSDMRWF